MITAIWAQDKNGLIGDNGDLPWHNPDDLKMFKELTLGKTIVMGYSTFASLDFKPLPNRHNVVLTSKTLDVETVSSPEEMCQKYDDFIVIGGAKTYLAFKDVLERCIVTVIDGEYVGNVYVPDLVSGMLETSRTAYTATEKSAAREVIMYQKNYLPEAWSEITNPSQLITDLAGPDVYPEPDKVLNALNYTKPEDVKVVILGQDPYHTPGMAQGLSFSVPDSHKTPPSLRNILKELESDIGHRDSQDLTSWAKQGVLLLNTVLTVERGKANSHKNKGWEPFVDEIITYVDNLPQPIIFVLWGKHAQDKEALIKHKQVLKAAHPSPFSAHKGFFGTKPFSTINRMLTEAGSTPIEWI